MDICCENIRYNWTGGIDKNDQFYEIIWLNWCKKFNIHQDNNYVEILKKFIESHETSLKIFNLSSDKREEYGDLCDVIGLHHSNKKGHVNIYKSSKWIWEFTEPMHTQRINREKRKKQIELERQIQLEKITLCCKCKSKIDIYTCENCNETYCENCIQKDNDYCMTCADDIRCVVCHDVYNFDDMYYCVICNNHYCDGNVCMKYKMDDGRYTSDKYCYECLYQCDKCPDKCVNENNCENNCEDGDCVNTCCENCVTKCYDCNSQYCDDCLNRCVTCLRNYCNCNDECNNCRNIYLQKTSIERKKNLEISLKSNGLVLRRDSKYCWRYIDEALGDIDEIVQRMCEMKFLYDYCDFDNVMTTVYLEQQDEIEAGYFPDASVFDTSEYNVLSKIGKYPEIFPWNLNTSLTG